MRKTRGCICLWVTAVILGLASLFLILVFTVFKPKHPVTAVNSITISHLDFSIDITNLRVHLNLSLDAVVAVENPNRVGFKYNNSTAFLRYRGNDVGEIPIPVGEIGAHATRILNLTLTLMADRLLSDSDFFSDVKTGTLRSQIFIRLPGKVRVLFVFYVVAYATCDMEINLITRRVDNQICHYKTKL
ncbi:hypothetical protein CDL12_24936 [Handroanthus impetiginosus]|uniref:Late embryogenesis abundant protein LEA-2 subgroup domain-containing protein n=1 Tax=Handroanthus impetiginosus TaxID=429701 RepID=A0A2G9GB87_9LAMI|nr:hypothetical protein CDL12_24936 [Handroanthus impetiginosus]